MTRPCKAYGWCNTGDRIDGGGSLKGCWRKATNACLLVNSKMAWKDHKQAKRIKDLDVKDSNRGAVLK